MKRIEKIINKGIACLMPIYQQGKGNATKIIADDGSTYIDSRTTKTILKQVCRYYTIHLEASRDKYGKVLNQRLCVPLALHSSVVLIPLKMRKPLFPRDGAYGYVNLYSIKNVEESKQNTKIQLKEDISVICLHRLNTVIKQINKAKLIASDLFYPINKEEPDELRDFFVEYNSPATRGDIARLRHEIIELQSALKKILQRSK